VITVKAAILTEFFCYGNKNRKPLLTIRSTVTLLNLAGVVNKGFFIWREIMGNLSIYDARINNLKALPLLDQVRQAFLDAEFVPPSPILMDGKIHRFSVADKNDDAGWYILYNDGIPAGTIGNWKSGQTHSFRARLDRIPTQAEEFSLNARMEELKNLRAKEMERKHAQAAETVSSIWDSAGQATAEHGYLQKKGVQPHGARVGGDGRLIVPLYNNAGCLSSLQYIGSDGKKMYHPGGQVGKCFYQLGDVISGEPIYIAEGFATSATICEIMKSSTIVAFSANNLEPVTGAIRAKYPGADIVLIADNDKSGTGMSYATQAAAKHGARVVLVPLEGQDANDYVQTGNDLKMLLMPSRDMHWLTSDTELTAQPSPIRWLIKGWLQAESLLMVHGASGCGKTFIVLDWVLSIAYKTHWHDKKIHGGTVVYLAGEGHNGLRGRVAAWKQKNPDAGTGKFFLSSGAVDLNIPSALSGAIAEIRMISDKPKIIVVDTLHRFLAGDENSAQDAKGMIDSCSILQKEFSCSVLLVHHTGVSDEAQHRARGSSAWRGALENEISVRTTGKIICIEQKKVKNAETLEPVFVSLSEVIITGWVDDDGESVTSAVIEPAKKPVELTAGDRQDNKDERRLFEIWAGSGAEITEYGDPYMTYSAIKRYVMGVMGKDETTAKAFLNPAKSSSFVSRLIKKEAISAFLDGYKVTSEDIKTRLFLYKK
jgi:phage/plasmid primase-like uncharacterized protein